MSRTLPMNLILGMGSGDEILTGNGKMVGVGSRSMSGDLILNTAEISRFYFVLFVAAGFSLRTLKGAATMVSGNSNRIQYNSRNSSTYEGLKRETQKEVLFTT